MSSARLLKYKSFDGCAPWDTPHNLIDQPQPLYTIQSGQQACQKVQQQKIKWQRSSPKRKPEVECQLS